MKNNFFGFRSAPGVGRPTPTTAIPGRQHAHLPRRGTREAWRASGDAAEQTRSLTLSPLPERQRPRKGDHRSSAHASGLLLVLRIIYTAYHDSGIYACTLALQTVHLLYLRLERICPYRKGKQKWRV